MWTRLLHFLYNLDRAIASLFGAPPQETISSEIGRKAARPGIDEWDVAAKVLNTIDHNHTDDAVAHADRLNKADDGVEK